MINIITFKERSWLPLLLKSAVHYHDLETLYTLALFCTFMHSFLNFLLQESYSLASPSPALRAVARGDTMLVIYKLKVTDNL